MSVPVSDVVVVNQTSHHRALTPALAEKASIDWCRTMRCFPVSTTAWEAVDLALQRDPNPCTAPRPARRGRTIFIKACSPPCATPRPEIVRPIVLSSPATALASPRRVAPARLQSVLWKRCAVLLKTRQTCDLPR